MVAVEVARVVSKYMFLYRRLQRDGVVMLASNSGAALACNRCSALEMFLLFAIG